jgi:hypothetical protein
MSIDIKPREAVRSRFFTLPHDVHNPHHDKRCRYGIRGVKKFAAGLTVHAVDYVQVYVINGDEKVQETTEYRFDGLGGGFLPEDLRNVFAELDPREDRGPQNLGEAAAECGVSISCLCEYAVKHLLASGKVTIGEIIDAYEKSPA